MGLRGFMAEWATPLEKQPNTHPMMKDAWNYILLWKLKGRDRVAREFCQIKASLLRETAYSGTNA